MKRKIGTIIDAALYEKVKTVARREGRGVNEVIEDALARYMVNSGPRPSIVDQTRGTFKVSDRVFRAVLDEDVYGVD